MTKIKFNKKDLVSGTVGVIGGTSTGFAAYVTAMIPIMIAEAGGTNKGLIRIAKLGAMVGSALVCWAASDRLVDITEDILEDGITLGIKNVNIDKNGVTVDIDK